MKFQTYVTIIVFLSIFANVWSSNEVETQFQTLFDQGKRSLQGCGVSKCSEYTEEEMNTAERLRQRREENARKSREKKELEQLMQQQQEQMLLREKQQREQEDHTNRKDDLDKFFDEIGIERSTTEVIDTTPEN